MDGRILAWEWRSLGTGGLQGLGLRRAGRTWTADGGEETAGVGAEGAWGELGLGRPRMRSHPSVRLGGMRATRLGSLSF